MGCSLMRSAAASLVLRLAMSRPLWAVESLFRRRLIAQIHQALRDENHGGFKRYYGKRSPERVPQPLRCLYPC